MQRAKYVALALATTGALSGCGGGGGGSSPDTFGEFYGSWKYPVGSCYKSPDVWLGDRYYANNEVVLTFTATSVQNKQIYYSDAKCTVKAGAITSSGTASWSSGSASGRTNVARVLATSTGNQISADGGTGLQLSGLPTTGKVDKLLIDVADGKMCVGSDTKTADSDGYPTVIAGTDCWIR